jgi:nucleolar protein 6
VPFYIFSRYTALSWYPTCIWQNSGSFCFFLGGGEGVPKSYTQYTGHPIHGDSNVQSAEMKHKTETNGPQNIKDTEQQKSSASDAIDSVLVSDTSASGFKAQRAALEAKLTQHIPTAEVKESRIQKKKDKKKKQNAVTEASKIERLPEENSRRSNDDLSKTKKSKKRRRDQSEAESLLIYGGDVATEADSSKGAGNEDIVGPDQEDGDQTLGKDEAKPSESKDRPVSKKQKRYQKGKMENKDLESSSDAKKGKESEPDNINGDSHTTLANASRRFICFVGNLPFTTTVASLTAHLTALSAVPTTVRLMSKTDDPTLCRGYGFAEFAGEREMRNCLRRCHHSEFEGRKINIELT